MTFTSASANEPTARPPRNTRTWWKRTVFQVGSKLICSSATSRVPARRHDLAHPPLVVRVSVRGADLPIEKELADALLELCRRCGRGSGRDVGDVHARRRGAGGDTTRGREGNGRQGRHEAGGEDGPIPGRAHGPDYPRKPGPRLAQGQDDRPAHVIVRRPFERERERRAAGGRLHRHARDRAHVACVRTPRAYERPPRPSTSSRSAPPSTRARNTRSPSLTLPASGSSMRVKTSVPSS